MLLSQALSEKKMDVRLQDKLLAEEKLSKEVIEKFLQSLPDDATNMQTVDEQKSSQDH